MSTADNKAVIRRFYDECWNTGNTDIIDQFIAPAYQSASVGQDRDHYIVLMQSLRTSFPDLHWAIEELIAEGDKVVNHWTLHGTHRGEYQGVAPTGKKVTMQGVTIFRLKDGKIVDRWALGDSAGLMRQLTATAA